MKYNQVYDDWATQRVDDFELHDQITLRWIAVSSSILSIVFGLGAFYLYARMRRRVFRHHLILLLLLFDFGKALVLLWYPARVLDVYEAYNNVNFCDVVGWFTSVFMEGADFAVLALAIHTALLVFRKQQQQSDNTNTNNNNNNSSNYNSNYNSTNNGGNEHATAPPEGLYRYRYFVYAVNCLLPMLMASLAFVHRGRKSYMPFITYCYLPVRPLWYRLVLSWIPRYLIIITILTIYISIYIYVKMEYRAVMHDFSQSQQMVDMSQYKKGWSGRWARIKSAALSVISSLPGFAYLDKNVLSFRHFRLSASGVPGKATPSGPPNRNNTDTEWAIMQFQRDSVIKFQVRRSMIERQVRSIFIYPGAYVFLWLAPFALQCLQYKWELDHGPVLWLTALTAFMMPFNCVVDSVAFAIRERPWVDRRGRLFTKKNYHNMKHTTHQWLNRSRSRRHAQFSPKSEQSSDASDRSADMGELEKAHYCDINTRRGSANSGYDYDHNKAVVRAIDWTNNRPNGDSLDLDSQAYSPKDTCYLQIPPRAYHRTTNEVDPMSTVGRKIELDDHYDDYNDDNDDGREMDLLEFLR
uniref:ARAD1A12914p n=1 Tax=Blastobotrys adeninivorans TaxID=409370 RepID=A0A060T332_BLAAD